MNRSESIINLSKALLQAQKEMESAKKDSNNPFFKSKYADYNAVLEACKGPLNNAGIVILQPHKLSAKESGEAVMVVQTMLIHAETGEFIIAETPVMVSKQNDPQSLFSGQTYSRRYSLQSLISLPSADDDGNKASGKDAEPVGRPAKIEVKSVETKEEPKAETPVRRRQPVKTEDVPKKQQSKVETKPEESTDQWD